MSKVTELERKHLGGVGNAFYGEMAQLAKSLEDENERLRGMLLLARGRLVMKNPDAQVADIDAALLND